MEIKEILKREIERLNEVNNKLVDHMSNTQINLCVCEQIQKNALAICEIAKANDLL